MKMKIFDKISVLVSAAALLMTGCGKWTQPEHLEFYRQTMEESDPENYARYLEALRSYKQSDHNVMIVGMDGSDSYPSSQNQHILAMPDSADYVVVRMDDVLHPRIAQEIPEALEKKGTRTLLFVDYAEISEAWTELEDERADKGEDAGTDEELVTFFKGEAKKQLARCNEFAFHGVVVSFQGTKVAGFAYNSQDAFMSAVKEFHAENPDKEMIFRGGARNVIDQEFLNEFKYIVIIAGEEKKLSVLPGRILGSTAPKDRVIMELTVPSVDVPEQLGMSPVEAASWVISEDHSGYEVKGLCVENAHDDYFSKEMAFKNVRSAITVMNTPSTTQE